MATSRRVMASTDGISRQPGTAPWPRQGHRPSRGFASALSLGFDAPLEARYQEDQRATRLAFLQGGLMLSLALMGGFLVVDAVWLHHYPLRVFVALFGVVAPLFALALLATVIGGLQDQAVAAACVALVAAGVVLAWAGVQAEGRADYPPYMFGSCLVYVPFAYLFSGARFRVNAAIALAFGAFCVVMQAQSGRTLEVQLTSAYLLAAMNGASGVARYMLDRAHRHDFLTQQLVREMAERDALTGLYNRRVFRERFGRLLDEARRERRSLSVLLLDIDRFKSVNDLAGHALGDAILYETAVALTSGRPADDCIARLGGDEFGLVWQRLDPEGARTAAEALRAEVEARYRACIAHHGGATAEIGVGASVGVVTIEAPGADDSIDSLLRRADEALYAAKRAGRGRVVAR